MVSLNLFVLKWRATHVENFLSQNCNIFTVLSIFKWNKIGETNNKFVTCRSFLSSDIRTSIKENDELSYMVWSLVTVRNQLPAQVVKLPTISHRSCQKSSRCHQKNSRSLLVTRFNLLANPLHLHHCSNIRCNPVSSSLTLHRSNPLSV